MNNNNDDDRNTNNENSSQMKNHIQMPKKQLSFITLPQKGQQGKKVLKSFKSALHRSLPSNIETKVVCAEQNWVPVSKAKTNQSSIINMIYSIILHVQNVKTTTQEKQAGDFMNGFVTIVGKIANLTC